MAFFKSHEKIYPRLMILQQGFVSARYFPSFGQIIGFFSLKIFLNISSYDEAAVIKLGYLRLNFPETFSIKDFCCEENLFYEINIRMIHFKNIFIIKRAIIFDDPKTKIIVHIQCRVAIYKKNG